MRERVFGIETEYAVVYHPSRAERVDGRRPTNLVLFQHFERELAGRLASLPRAFSLLRAKPGVFLENGASFHYEATPREFEHGLVEKSQAGRILLRAERRDGSLRLIVKDDGVGLPPSWNGNGRGFGLKNVTERLRALYGDSARLEIANGAGVGVTVTITLPWRVHE